jgi:hypothetical protein
MTCLNIQDQRLANACLRGRYQKEHASIPYILHNLLQVFLNNALTTTNTLKNKHNGAETAKQTRRDRTVVKPGQNDPTQGVAKTILVAPHFYQHGRVQ